MADNEPAVPTAELETERAAALPPPEDDEGASPKTAPTGNGPDEPALAAVVADLADQIREINRISEERERIIDRLHHENQQLKQGEMQRVLLPIFRDLIRFNDDLKTTAASYFGQAGSEKIEKELTCYRETIDDILYRYGVEQIDVTVGGSFNPKEHRAVATISTADETADRTISKIIRGGFRTDTAMIRNAEVEVCRYVPAAIEVTVEAQSTTATAEREAQSEDK